jgi:hypothetical protein
MATPDEVDLRVHIVGNAVIVLTGAMLSLSTAMTYIRQSLQHPGVPGPVSPAADRELEEARQGIAKAIKILEGIDDGRR